ncbi:MAG TPA: hypothetical protein VNM48_06470 [Chloroflexota bacterium]|nr:hypothetical protein [Chloroflexota bacterium]
MNNTLTNDTSTEELVPPSEARSEAPTPAPTWKLYPRHDEVLGPIESGEQVDAYLKRRAALEAEVALIKAQAKAMLSPLQNDLDHIDRTHAHLGEQFIRAQNAATKKKTFAFWHGTARLRTIPGGLRVRDEAAALAYAQRTGLLGAISPPTLRTQEFLSIARDNLQEQGEIPDGCEIEEPRVSFSLSSKPAAMPIPFSTEEESSAQEED